MSDDFRIPPMGGNPSGPPALPKPPRPPLPISAPRIPGPMPVSEGHHSPEHRNNSVQVSSAKAEISEEDSRELTLRDYYETILRYRFWFLSTVVFCFCGAITMHFILPKKYSASTKLVKNEAIGKNPMSMLLMGKESTGIDINTLKEIAKSSDVIKRCLEYIPQELNEYLSSGLKVSEEEKMTIDLIDKSIVASAMSIQIDSATEEILIISASLDNCPYLTAAIANGLSQALLQALSDNRRSKYRFQIENLNQTIQQNSEDIRKAEMELKLLLDPTDGITLGSSDSKTSKALEFSEEKLNDAELNKKIIDDRLTSLRREFDIENIPLENIRWINTGSPLYTKLQNLIFERDELLTRYKEANPSIIKINHQINALQENLQPDKNPDLKYVVVDSFRVPMVSELITLHSQLASTDNRINALKSQLDTLNRRLLEAPEEQKKVRELQGNLDMMEKMHLEFYKSLHNAKMMLLSSDSGFEVLEKAAPSMTSSSPGLVKYAAIGLCIGLGLGIAISLVLNSWENTLKSSLDIHRHFKTGALGAIPRWEDDNKYIDEMVPDSIIAEAYGVLRNNVRFSRFHHPEKCLLIASASQNEGKSLTSINLALSFALEGNNVLLIAADLRRPYSHTRFRRESDIKKTVGMVEYLEEKASLEEVIYVSNFGNFSFVPTCARATNPAKLLKQNLFAKLLAYGEQHYDVVIVDSPAVLPVVDASLISPMVKGVLLVAKANQTTVTAIQETINRLEHVGSPFLGVSLNMIRDLQLENFYGYGQSTYNGKDA